jgi:hypothetical protein
MNLFLSWKRVQSVGEAKLPKPAVLDVSGADNRRTDPDLDPGIDAHEHHVVRLE